MYPMHMEGCRCSASATLAVPSAPDVMVGGPAAKLYLYVRTSHMQHVTHQHEAHSLLSCRCQLHGLLV